MLNVFLKGGIMMYPLLLCSMTVLAIVIYKFLSLRKPVILDAVYIEKLKNAILTQGRAKVLAQLQESQQPFEQYLGIVLSASLVSREEAKEKLQAHESFILLILDKYLSFLHTMITLAPMIGLLGTVLGLMDIFAGLGRAAAGDVTQLYGGISIALINTVTGLGIAIFSAVFYQVFTHRIEVLSSKIDHQVQVFLEFCRTQL